MEFSIKFNENSLIEKFTRSSTSGSSTFITEPYAYREYFDAQGYIPSRTTIYSEAETPTTIGYEARYVTAHPKATSIYAKTVTSAAGLTVDLPSPDSGIGAESITPRDQTNIQQVMNFFRTYLFFATNLNLLNFTNFFVAAVACHEAISIRNKI